MSKTPKSEEENPPIESEDELSELEYIQEMMEAFGLTRADTIGDLLEALEEDETEDGEICEDEETTS